MHCYLFIIILFVVTHFTFLVGHSDKVKYKFKINPNQTQKEMLLIEAIVLISKETYATISLVTR